MINTVRYFSQMIMPGIAAEGQAAIAAAKVLVIGAGGLGCPVLAALAAMGTGHIGIIDDDMVEMKNLHRQLLYSEADIGKPKVQVALQKLQAQNSEVTITVYPERFTEPNAAALVAAYDIIVDCCDNAATRYIIDQHTKAQNKPFVYGAVRQWQGQLSVFNFRNGPSYKNLFADEAAAAAETDCASTGIMAHITGIIGSLQVNEVVKIITGDDEHVLSGEVLTIDLQGLEFRKFKVKSY